MSTNEQDRDQWTLKMKDLCRLADVSRQQVHYYIKEGLLPEGRKTGRNMAYYGEVHVDRLALIKRLQHERFLPLKAIKALLDDADAEFSAPQRQFLRELRRGMTQSDGSTQRDEEVLANAPHVTEHDLEQLVAAGAIGGATAADGSLLLTANDAAIVGVMSKIREAGFTSEAGFEVEDVLLYDEAMTRLARREAVLFARKLAGSPPEQAAAMVEAALPHIHEIMVRYHRARIDDLLSMM